MKNHRGLSLIEVLVTITITSIGLMGLISLQMQAVRATTDTGNRSQAIWIFNDLVNRIHANEEASGSYTTDDPYVCGGTPKICSTYSEGAYGGAPVSAQDDCTGAELADWDLFEIACGAPKNDGIISNAIDYLPSAQLTVSCVDAGCSDGDALSITLQWRAKADDESITGAERTANSGILTLSDIITP
jgi:type IV pilus assembly protein PilV